MVSFLQSRSTINNKIAIIYFFSRYCIIPFELDISETQLSKRLHFVLRSLLRSDCLISLLSTFSLHPYYMLVLASYSELLKSVIPLAKFINRQSITYIFDSSVNILLFADDAIIFSTIKSQIDILILQSDLDQFLTSNRRNYLPLNININKWNVIIFSRLDNVITYNYIIDNCTITRVTSIRDYNNIT